jgi:hypothetical protein
MKAKNRFGPKTVPTPEISVPDKVKTSGITMRGAGAATKGTTSRGPMA